MTERIEASVSFRVFGVSGFGGFGFREFRG